MPRKHTVNCSTNQEQTAEVWKGIVGYEGLYEVSSTGRVRTVPRTIWFRGRWGKIVGRNKPGQILRQQPHAGGYWTIMLVKNLKFTLRLVHHLVLEAFVGPRPKNMECCHGNGNKKDNKLENLRWDTRSNNNRDRRLHGKQTKLCLEQIIEIRKLYAAGQYSQQKLGEMFNVSQSMIGAIVRNKAWVL